MMLTRMHLVVLWYNGNCGIKIRFRHIIHRSIPTRRTSDRHTTRFVQELRRTTSTSELTTTATESSSSSTVPGQQCLGLVERICTAERTSERVLDRSHVFPYVLHNVIHVEHRSEELANVIRATVVRDVDLVLLVRVTVVMGTCGQNHFEAEKKVLQFLRENLVVVLFVGAKDVLDDFQIDQQIDDHSLAEEVEKI